MVDRGLVARRWQPRWFGRLLLGIAVVLAGCGGDPVPPGVPDSSIPDALPGTPKEVEEALLNTDDLGEGWVDLGAVPLDERGFEGCPETGVVTGGEDPARLGEAQSLYNAGDPPVPTLGESISLWESPEVAAERFAVFASMTSECRAFEHEMLDGSTATVRMLPHDAPPLGDEAVGVVIEFDQDEGPTILRNTMLVRIGDVLVLTEGIDRVGDDPDAVRQQERFHELTGQAVDKAPESCPTDGAVGPPVRGPTAGRPPRYGDNVCSGAIFSLSPSSSPPRGRPVASRGEHPARGSGDGTAGHAQLCPAATFQWSGKRPGGPALSLVMVFTVRGQPGLLQYA